VLIIFRKLKKLSIQKITATKSFWTLQIVNHIKSQVNLCHRYKNNALKSAFRASNNLQNRFLKKKQLQIFLIPNYQMESIKMILSTLKRLKTLNQTFNYTLQAMISINLRLKIHR
jgi:hypothetical protein